MGRSWKDKYGHAGGGSKGDGLFVTVKDGESVEFIVHPDAEPHEQCQRWDDPTNKYVDCDATHPKAQVRIIVAALVVSKKPGRDAKSVPVNDVKILKFSPSTFRDLTEKMAHERVGGLEQIYEWSRVGSGMTDTKHSITRIDKASDEQLRRLKGVEPPDLGRYGSPIPESGEGTAPSSTGVPAGAAQPAADDDIPF